MRWRTFQAKPTAPKEMKFESSQNSTICTFAIIKYLFFIFETTFVVITNFATILSQLPCTRIVILRRLPT